MRGRVGPRRPAGAAAQLGVLLAAGAAVAVYVALRYGGLWGDSDTHAFATFIRAMLADGRLVPDEHVYAHGYGYPVLATFLVHATGLPVAQLQIAGGALLSAWLVPPAWLAYRELTGSGRGATLATVILLVQPEFLFPILRGSHEKFTRGLMFVCLYLLARSILVQRQWRRFAVYVLAFYLAVFALITFNNLMATSFIVALGLALAFSLGARRAVGWRVDGSTATSRRLLYAVGISLVLVFLFTFHAYPPAQKSILTVESLVDRLALLVLDVEQTAGNPYQTISTTWISLPVYLLVSIANWLLLTVSFCLWSAQTLALWRNRTWPQGGRADLLWSLYGAFGLLGAGSIAVDLSGALAGNMQHRMFPSFAMIGAAVVAEWVAGRQRLRSRAHRLAYGALAVGIGFLGLLAVAKATNEPSISNKWQYYSTLEKTALLWSEAHAGQRTLWAGLDERVPAAMGICCPESFANLTLTGGLPRRDVRGFLISGIVRARAARVNLDLPIAADSLLFYTNGDADLYHSRPKTPFQR